ncbi:phosphatidylinositol N-acetylglucosaminyltransferase subunit P [Amborella trichopoda]|nr:phosphatidylinositol N-acetylglucosaminyltransferase subunit P [Amborella trichopoda]|eukprot:XP_011625766.1 phosphatidylinositol N-acetylglucosaminyltransferase subunit P [Amborella trichopoda]
MSDSSLNSPRRTLSLSKEKGTLSISDSDERVVGFGVSKENGPKPSEVYGFVGSITTVVATVVFLAWAYIPEPCLHFLGVTYYPNKYWALAVPAYGLVIVVSLMGFYVGLNFMITPPPTSVSTIFDEYTREPAPMISSHDGEQPIEPISDIPLQKINDLMFRSTKHMHS